MSTKPLNSKLQKTSKKIIPRTPSGLQTKDSKKSSTFPLSSHEEKNMNEDELDYLFNEVLSNSKTETPKEPIKNKCQHSSTINENGIDICVDCGENINIEAFDVEWRYYGDNDSKSSFDPTRCQYRKVQDKGIKKELDKLGFSREVIDKADYYYKLITNGDIKRSKLRKGIVSACVYYAYLSLGYSEITTIELGERFNIGKRLLSKGRTYFATRIPKQELCFDSFDNDNVQHFIGKLLKQFNVKDEHITSVLSLYKLLSEKSSLINTSNPQSVSSGLVYFFLKKLNVNITPSQFGKLDTVKLSEITISRIVNEIDNVLMNENITIN